MRTKKLRNGLISAFVSFIELGQRLVCPENDGYDCAQFANLIVKLYICFDY